MILPEISRSLDRTAEQVSIAALLDKLSHHKDQAKKETDEKKAELVKKTTLERERGEIIRKAAMQMHDIPVVTTVRHFYSVADGRGFNNC